MSSLFSLRDFSFRYDRKLVFDKVNLEIPDARIVAIMGPSGCGKSSFLSALNRIYELDPSTKVSGSLLYQGQNILCPTTEVEKLRAKIGMIFQNPICFPVSIFNNISIVLKESGISDRAKIEEQVEQLLRKVYLWDDVKDRLCESAQKLSGGQQQRLCIARCLARNSEILLMDEPCSALDPVTTSGIENLIKELSETKRIILVTHNIAQAKRLADHGILFWNDGEKAFVLESNDMNTMVDKPCCDLTMKYFSGELG